jgi:hypothetical protein
MKALISTIPRRLGWSALVYILTVGAAIWLKWISIADSPRMLTDGEIMTMFLTMPTFAAIAAFSFLTAACVGRPVPAVAETRAAPVAAEPAKPFTAQVVGLQWLNPLQRRDYST